jgi:hypothetical protein
LINRRHGGLAGKAIVALRNDLIKGRAGQAVMTELLARTRDLATQARNDA